MIHVYSKNIKKQKNFRSKLRVAQIWWFICISSTTNFHILRYYTLKIKIFLLLPFTYVQIMENPDRETEAWKFYSSFLQIIVQWYLYIWINNDRKDSRQNRIRTFEVFSQKGMMIYFRNGEKNRSVSRYHAFIWCVLFCSTY